MRTTVHKLFWIWQLAKEEAWINEMADHGYGLVSAGRITFEFEDIEAGRYRYKELFMKGSFSSDKTRKFLKFMEEMGAANVGHVSYPGHAVIYLRYENTNEGFELYSDLDSRIEYEKTMCGYLVFAAVINILAWIYNMAVFIASCMHSYPTYISLLCSVNLILAVVIAVELIKRNNKIRSLKAEREIHE